MSNGKVPTVGELSDRIPDISELTDKDPNIGILPDTEATKQFRGGMVQGAVFDPITGINQLMEHASSNKIGLPDSVKKWLEDYKEKYTPESEDTFGAGNAGRVAGTIGSMFIPGGPIAKGISKLPDAATALSLPRTSTALSRIGQAVPQALKGSGYLTPSQKAIRGAGIGATGSVMQPTDEDGDFSRKKGLQALAGAASGGLAGPLGGPATAGGAGYLASKMVHELGWPATIGIFSALGTSLYSLAHLHGLGDAVMKSRKLGEAVFSRPGAQYAIGRAAGAGTEKAKEMEDQ